MPIKEGWEVPPNKQKTFEQIVNTDAVGDPILTSKCHNRNVYGFLVVSDRGIAWRKN